MTQAVGAGSFGGDFSGWRLDSDLKARQAKDAGGEFFVRYSAGKGNQDDNTQWKLTGADEIRNITSRGFDLLANSEWFEDRVCEGGRAGRADGHLDRDFWGSRGYNRGAHIVVSWDAYPNPQSYSAVEDYLGEYGNALEDEYRLGLYGGSDAIAHMKKAGVIDVGWQINSTSFSTNHLPYQPSRETIQWWLQHPPLGIDMWQTGNYWFNKQVDENVMLTDKIITHLKAAEAPDIHRPPHPKPRPKPHHQRIEGHTYRVRPSDSDGLIAICHRHGVADWRRVAYLNDIHGPDYKLHPGDVIRWPRQGPGERPKPPTKATYTVKSGDTMSSIANRWGVNLYKLEQANPHAGHPAGNFDEIHVGDVLRHP